MTDISLIITVEVVKFWQASLINSDLDMYNEETDTPSLARTSSLVEELGQIEYIFSDKTGTLTCNQMVFRQCSIAGRCYADKIDDSKRLRLDESGNQVGHYSFDQLKQDVIDSSYSGCSIVGEFLELLAVCHTVIPEVKESSKGIVYQASSPDEGALVKGAALLGFEFHVICFF